MPNVPPICIRDSTKGWDTINIVIAENIINEMFVVILVGLGKFARYSLIPTNSDSSDSCLDVINK